MEHASNLPAPILGGVALAVVLLIVATVVWRKKSRKIEKFMAQKEVELRQFERMANANSSAYAKPTARIGKDAVSSSDYV